MPYVTIRQSPMYHQITFDEILAGNVDLRRIVVSNETNTRTYFSTGLNENFLDKYNFPAMVRALEMFCLKHDALYQVDRHTLYNTFPIPKKTGGIRVINAPVPALMEALRELKGIFENQMFALYHTSAFAYIEKRSTISSLKRHQQNESRWFLKTDFSDFFGSTTPAFLMNMLSMIFPFSEVVKEPGGADVLARALDLCFLDGGLPQGTPISPMLTNLMMIPIDHRLYNCLREYVSKDGWRRNYVYTRYADDILISCKQHFDHEEIVGFINSTLSGFRAPFKIKDEKTRYGSRSGSNWNLGLMLNKDNNITIGYKNKNRFRAMISNYVLCRAEGKNWDLHEVQVLRGLTNYYLMVEEDWVKDLLSNYGEKYHINIMQAMAADLAC